MYYKEHYTPTVPLPEMDTMRMLREIAERKGMISAPVWGEARVVRNGLPDPMVEG